MVKRKRAATSKKTKAKSHGYPHAHIPHEVLLLILHKLPVKALMKFTCVCKLWRESIVNDPRFIETHLVESQKNPILLFKFLPKTIRSILLPSLDSKIEEHDTNYLLYLPKDEFGFGTRKKALPHLHQHAVLYNSCRKRLIGNCNGLVCYLVGDPFKLVQGDWFYSVIEIFNFSKLEKIRIVSRIHYTPKWRVHDCRFGYDCISNKYKLICIMGSFVGGEVNLSYRYLILTLGCGDSLLWREIQNPATAPQMCSTQPSHCINGAIYWWMRTKNYKERALLSFDLHEEKFQVIELPVNLSPYSVDNYHQFEYRRCLCVARIKASNSTHGVVELYLLKDRMKQTWVEETITFDLPVTIQIPLLPVDNKNPISNHIVELAGRLILYWGDILLHNGRKSRVIHFYDLQSRQVKQVRIGSKCSSKYDVTKHVENLISLRAWATKEGDGGELGRFDDTSRIMQDMFKQMPSSHSAAVSFFSSSSGKIMR